MENINITVNRQTRMIDRISKRQLGNDGENLQENLIFSFDDEFVDGTGRLEVTMPDDTKSYIMLTKVNETYQLPVKSVMTKSGRIYMQLVITEGTNNEDIPIFKSNTFYVKVNESINAETIQEEEFPDFIDIANTKLNQMDNFDINVSKTGNTATIEVTNRLGETTTASISDGQKGDTGATGPQGEPGYTPVKGVDYYTEEEKEEMIDYVINDSESAFNQNVAQKTNAFNTNADSKTNAFNSNATSKTGDFNTNATSKTTLFDNNATSKTTAFNTNASEKNTAFNNNAISKTSDFDSHVSGKTTDFDTHVTSKVGEYDANATEKTTTFNSNASSKLEEYNTNATSKVSDYNENAQDKIDEYDEHVEETQETINDLQEEVDDLRRNQKQYTASGTNIYVDDAFDTRIMESRMSKESTQETTEGKNLLPNTATTTTSNGITFTKNNDGTYTLNGTATADTYISIYSSINSNVVNDSSKNYTFSSGVSNSDIGVSIWEYDNSWTAIKYVYNPSTPYTPTGTQTGQMFRIMVKNGAVLSNIKVYPMLVEGTTVGDYEPYTNGSSPNPSYPQDVKTVKGYRNLFDKENINWYRNNLSNFSNTLNSSTNRIRTNSFEIQGGKTYIISGYPSSVSLLAVRGYDSDQNYSTSLVSINNNVITLTEEAKYIHLLFGGTDFTDETNELMKNANIQIVEGEQELPYVPYGNNYVDVKVTGKNLFDGVLRQGGWSGYSPNRGYSVNGIPVKGNNTQYTITTNIDTTRYKWEANVSDRPLPAPSFTQILNRGWQTGTKLVINVPTDGYLYLGFAALDGTSNINVDDLNEFHYQVELGEETSYEPYKESIITIPLNGNEIVGIGDYKDEPIVDKNGKCWLNKKTGKVVLDGSETYNQIWSKPTNITNGFRTSIQNILISNSTSELAYILSNYFIGSSQDNAYNNSGRICRRLNQSEIIINFDNIENINDLQTWLSTHNSDVYYPLATPQLIDLNYTVDIRLFNGVNNISNSDDMDMEIKYVQDINQIINNITNAMLEIGGN